MGHIPQTDCQARPAMQVSLRNKTRWPATMAMIAFCILAPLLDVSSKLAAAAIPVGQVTLARFVVQAALEKAEKIIESEATMVLTRRESLRLLELMENPPPRNAKFLQAQERYQKVKADAGSAAAR